MNLNMSKMLYREKGTENNCKINLYIIGIYKCINSCKQITIFYYQLLFFLLIGLAFLLLTSIKFSKQTHPTKCITFKKTRSLQF